MLWTLVIRNTIAYGSDIKQLELVNGFPIYLLDEGSPNSNTMHGPLIVENSSKEGDDQTQPPRYDVSIYDTPFFKLPDPKRVWIGAPGSALEGIGSRS